MHTTLSEQNLPIRSGRSSLMDSEQDSQTTNSQPSKQISTVNGADVHLLYVEAFKRVAKKYNVVLGIRAPNPLGESLLRENHPSKNFHMKAKSSPSGPTAGFIAENPIYSKVSRTAYKKQSDYIAAAINKGAKALPLKISRLRIEELVAAEVLIHLGQDRYCAWYPSGLQHFKIRNDGLVLDDKLKPVRVMSNLPQSDATVAPLPITADYDLFTIIPKESQSVNTRPLRAAPKVLRGNFNLDFIKPKALHGQQEDPDMGNLHEFGKTIVRALNKEIAQEGYRGGNLVWHNDETGNPFSPGFDAGDKPIFVHPSQRISQFHSLAEIIGYYKRLRSEKYAPEYSPIFGF